MTVIWMDPPPYRGRGRPTVWVDRLSPLIEHPKRWALVHAYDQLSTAIKAIRRLEAKADLRPSGSWEFVARSLEDGTGGVFARYLGPDEDES